MRRAPAALLAAALFAAALAPTTARGAADAFYTTLLRQGRDAYREHRAKEAVEQLRIATFGLLDDPVLLTEALVRLAVAQRASGREDEAQATAARFAQVEEKFHLYTKASLEPDVRSEFEGLLGRRLPGEMASAPAAPAAAPPRAAPPRAATPRPSPPRSTAARAEPTARVEPTAAPSTPSPIQAAREAAAQGDAKAAVRLATRALDAEPNSDEALAIRAHALTQRDSCRAALSDLRRLPSSRFSTQPELWADLFVCLVSTKERAEARSIAANVPSSEAARPDVARARRSLGLSLESAELRMPSPSPPPPPSPSPAPAPPSAPEAAPRAPAVDPITEARQLRLQGKRAESKDVLASAAEKDPKNRELRKELLEAAYLAKDWTLAAAQIAPLDPFQDGEEPWMFYAAVGAWETGRQETARTLARRARTRISDDPFVDLYMKKILGR